MKTKTTALNSSILTIRQSLTAALMFAALFIFLLVLAIGCSDDSTITNPTGSGNDNVTLSVKSDESIADNPADVIITEAKALITEVELETEPSGTSQHIRVAPFVVNFNMSGTLISIASANIPAGSYNKIKFKIHKPEDTEVITDPEFRTGSSGNERYSFIVKGTYNGTSFIYRSRKSANLVINFNSLINLQTSAKNITLLVNPSLWFKNGSVVIDPNNSQNENTIDDNLKNSFKRAFRDDNKDGLPDDN
jgi:hypothetical protein